MSFQPLSDKHIAPCPICRRPSWDCEAHTPEAWADVKRARREDLFSERKATS